MRRLPAVEDERAAADLIVILPQREGYDVIQASSTEEKR